MSFLEVLGEVTGQTIVEKKEIIIPFSAIKCQFNYLMVKKLKEKLEKNIASMKEIRFPHPEPSRIILIPNDLIRLHLNNNSDYSGHIINSLDLIAQNSEGYSLLASYEANGKRIYDIDRDFASRTLA